MLDKETLPDTMTLQKHNAQFVVLDKDRLIELLKGSNNVADAIDRIDKILVPVTKFRDGLTTKEDKTNLDYLVSNASDKMYVYSTEATGIQYPITKIKVNTKEGIKLDINGDEATISIEDYLRKIITENGVITINDTNKVTITDTDTVKAIVSDDGSLSFDASDLEKRAFEYSLIFS